MRIGKPLLAGVTLALLALTPDALAQEASLAAGRNAYENSEFTTAISILKAAATKDPGNGEIYLLLTKAYLGEEQFDAAIASGEKAVAINPKNSECHNWLGQAFGEKADRASMLGGFSLARKTQKEFEIALQLDEHNLDAAQNLIEFDCAAPSIVGGGEDKARPLIQKLLALDASQGHFAAGKCRLQKKDVTAAEAEFTRALGSKPKSVELIQDIAAYFANHGAPERVLAAAEAAHAAAPEDPRVPFFRALAWILKGERLPESEKILRNFIEAVPRRPTYPSVSFAHYWLGQLYEKQKNTAAARGEYEAALKLNAKYKRAQEALKHLGKS